MNFTNWEAVGTNIERLRKMRRWTQRELAAKVNIHSSMVTRWERGQIQPKDEQLALLASVLNVEIEEFFHGESAPKTPYRLADRTDPELAELVHQIPSLDIVDKQALKAVIQAMVVKARIRDAMGSAMPKVAV